MVVGAPEVNKAFVFARGSTGWTTVAALSGSNTERLDRFGESIAISGDGTTLAVGAPGEDSKAQGTSGADQGDNSVQDAGAVYIFARTGTAWTQQAYIKASNTGPAAQVYERFGDRAIALSRDGNTLVVGAPYERGKSKGVNGNQTDKWTFSGGYAPGAAFVFTRSGASWSQQAYIKASNAGKTDQFGFALALSADGNTLAVGAWKEASGSTGVDGDQGNMSFFSGAVYVYGRTGSTWRQDAFVKASNTGSNDAFGWSVALSADGTTMAVGAIGEASSSPGINGSQGNNGAPSSGAVYVFARTLGAWSQQAYIKASNPDGVRGTADWGDQFGIAVALSADGSILAVGSDGEDGGGTGVSGNPADNSVDDAGAAYVFRRRGGSWRQDAYVKASNTGAGDGFGAKVALSADGRSLAVAAMLEASRALGVGGDQRDNSVVGRGAVYLY